MRLKHKPWAEPLIEKHPKLIVTLGEEWRGKWIERFAKKQPIHLEIGTGKGRFIRGLAEKYPDINFIGLEVQSSAIVMALEKQIEQPLPNLQLFNGNARDLTEYFSDGEVDKILLTFSDPWPKTRHEKRRLTHKGFLKQYEQILIPSGEFYFKTDNQELFEYSLTSLSQYGMLLEEVILDLHASDQATENIQTEFEEKFAKAGNRIYQLRAKFLVDD